MPGKIGTFIKGLTQREAAYNSVRPTNALLFLTYRCTSQCRTCSMWKRRSEEVELDAGQWIKIVDSLFEAGIKHIELFGGDALLRKDIVLLLAGYKRETRECSVDLVINGNLVDGEAARQLAASGLDEIYVSVDAVGATHDRVRGVPGSFDHASGALRQIIEARKTGHTPKITVNCTVSRFTVGEFEKVYDFALGCGADKVAFEYVGEFPQDSVNRSAFRGITPEPFYLQQGDSVLAGREEAVLLKDKIEKIKRNADRSIHVVTKNIDCLTVEEMSQGRVPNKKCYMCRSLVVIDPYGNVLPCAFYNKYSLGNAASQSIGEIWKNKSHLEFIDFIDNKKPDICGHCIVGVERNPTVMQAIRKMLLEKGIAHLAGRMLRKIGRIFFHTNSAWWFEYNAAPAVPDIKPGLPVEISYDLEEAVSWLRAQKEPWMYIPQEIKIARAYGHLYPLVKYGSKIIGYAKIGIKKAFVTDYGRPIPLAQDEAFFYDIYVDPKYRGHNIAPYLAAECIAKMKERGRHTIKLHIPAWNKASIAVAAKLGFRKYAFIRHFRILSCIKFNIRRAANRGVI
ncbi:MAG: GNAT family N-acetyltransferase [Candidatus Omnitrophota bacterium]